MRQFLIIAFCCLALAGCHLLPPKYYALPRNMQVLEEMDHWAAEGKFSVTDGQEAATGSFTWQQIGRKMKLEMSGPLGVGNVNIVGNVDGEFWLTSSRTGTVISDSGSQLAEDYLGMPLPVDSFPSWLKGIPDRDRKYSFVPDMEARETLLEQDGWRIIISSYEHQGELLLPRKLEAEKGNIRVKVVIKSWDVDET